MKIYLAGAINGCTDEECKDWRKKVKQQLKHECLDPMTRDYRGQEHIAYALIVEHDKRDIDSSDVMFVLYDRPTVGTSMEMLYAWERGKHVFLVMPKPVALSPWLTYHSHKFFLSIESAVAYINDRSSL